MKIGDLAKRSGMSVRMLRYYEAQGLLAPSRAANGYRDYDVADARTVQRIRTLRAAGMTLATIQLFLPCIRGDRPIFEPCDELRTTLRGEIDKADRETAALAGRRAMLQTFLDEIDAS